MNKAKELSIRKMLKHSKIIGEKLKIPGKRDWAFSKNDPLKIEPFKLRFLGRKSPPDRWVIDLSSDEKIILHPLNFTKYPIWKTEYI